MDQEHEGRVRYLIWALVLKPGMCSTEVFHEQAAFLFFFFVCRLNQSFLLTKAGATGFCQKPHTMRDPCGQLSHDLCGQRRCYSPRSLLQPVSAKKECRTIFAVRYPITCTFLSNAPYGSCKQRVFISKPIQESSLHTFHATQQEFTQDLG